MFRLLHQASLRCNKLAPTNPSKSDIAHWKETRTDLRALLESKDDDKSNKVSCIIRSLSRQYVDDQRHQYFTESNWQRALRQTTEDLILASREFDDERDGFINHVARETAEQRLEGVMLPRVERDRIRARYQSTFNRDVARGLGSLGTQVYAHTY